MRRVRLAVHIAALGVGGMGWRYACSRHRVHEVGLRALAHARVACCELRCNASTGRAACPPVIVTQLSGDSATAASRNLADVPLLATSMVQRLPHRRLQHRCFRGVDVTGTHPLIITHLPPLSTVTLPSALQVTAGGHGSSELRAAGCMSCATEQPLEKGDAGRERQQRHVAPVLCKLAPAPLGDKGRAAADSRVRGIYLES